LTSGSDRRAEMASANGRLLLPVRIFINRVPWRRAGSR
jgi:hypothetical protein